MGENNPRTPGNPSPTVWVFFFFKQKKKRIKHCMVKKFKKNSKKKSDFGSVNKNE